MYYNLKCMGALGCRYKNFLINLVNLKRIKNSLKLSIHHHFVIAYAIV